ncbi:MAG: V-type ATP synthase subunit D [bacterium]
MAISFQYNKTSLQSLEKNLKMRVRSLPTIKNKESALRLEVKRTKSDIAKLEEELEMRIAAYDKMLALWGEFDTTLLTVRDIKMDIKKIAGVRIPILEEVVYETKPYSIFNSPKWYADGLTELKTLAQVGIEREFSAQKLSLLEYARKKTTQKVNLFEKVQIPGYQDAIRKIKRFMEDEENLSKSSQKIVKAKQQAAAISTNEQ